MAHQRFAVLTPERFSALKNGDIIYALPEGEAPSVNSVYYKGKIVHVEDSDAGVIFLFDVPALHGRSALRITDPRRLARLTDSHVPRRQDWMDDIRPHPS